MKRILILSLFIASCANDNFHVSDCPTIIDTVYIHDTIYTSNNTVIHNANEPIHIGNTYNR